MLALENIWKKYTIGPTQLDVLKNISLTISEGELVAIIGPSGCGKSTLMNILGLLDKPSAGTYHIDKEPITYENDRALSILRNRRIGFIFQMYYLLPRLTAVENVILPLIYRKVRTSTARKMALDCLKQVGMEQRAGHRPDEMSGGQQQRVSIARAIIGRPSILLADEPTGALDTGTGQEIMNLFKKMNAEAGITIVIITHDPKIAAQCRRSIQMLDGRIYE